VETVSLIDSAVGGMEFLVATRLLWLNQASNHKITHAVQIFL